MSHDPDHPTARWDSRGLRLRGVLPLREARPADAAKPVRVTVAGAAAPVRQRVVELLARMPGLELMGWAESAQALALLDVFSEVCLVVESEPAGERGDRRPAAAGQPARPRLSPRQQLVLIAYAAANELLDVVARRLVWAWKP